MSTSTGSGAGAVGAASASGVGVGCGAVSVGGGAAEAGLAAFLAPSLSHAAVTITAPSSGSDQYLKNRISLYKHSGTVEMLHPGEIQGQCNERLNSQRQMQS